MRETKTQIIVAVIGLFGTIIAAMLTSLPKAQEYNDNAKTHLTVELPVAIAEEYRYDHAENPGTFVQVVGSENEWREYVWKDKKWALSRMLSETNRHDDLIFLEEMAEDDKVHLEIPIDGGVIKFCESEEKDDCFNLYTVEKVTKRN